MLVKHQKPWHSEVGIRQPDRHGRIVSGAVVFCYNDTRASGDGCRQSQVQMRRQVWANLLSIYCPYFPEIRYIQWKLETQAKLWKCLTVSRISNLAQLVENKTGA